MVQYKLNKYEYVSAWIEAYPWRSGIIEKVELPLVPWMGRTHSGYKLKSDDVTLTQMLAFGYGLWCHRGCIFIHCMFGCVPGGGGDEPHSMHNQYLSITYRKITTFCSNLIAHTVSQNIPIIFHCDMPGGALEFEFEFQMLAVLH